jgi:methylated-DNA-[protein]-cysteine S-methyltransferase
MDVQTHHIRTSIGILEVKTSEEGIRQIKIVNKKFDQKGDSSMHKYLKQLQEYVDGLRRTFDLPLHVQGTAFQKKVWKAALSIPYGTTKTYGQIARQIGHPKASRAVGTALGKNPVCVVVPCHRVVSSTGLGGYAHGLSVKKQLLELEGKNVARGAKVHKV